MLRRAGLFAAAALIAVSFGLKQAAAMGTDSPSPPTDSDSKKKKKKDQSSVPADSRELAEQKFLDGYRSARAMILAGQYEAGIAALHALRQDDHPDVANYIGYAERKLGKYDDSKFWYEKALAADPNHVRTWSYYGMWQMEQGNRLKAEDFLAKVKLICGNTDCTEYKQLKDVIDGRASY
jgi:tetratricopeptide (TPR) repeat protein